MAVVVLGISLFAIYANNSSDEEPNPTSNKPNPTPWYNKEAAYEILPESFQDSSGFNNGTAQLGEGVGDIKGILYMF